MPRKRKPGHLPPDGTRGPGNQPIISPAIRTKLLAALKVSAPLEEAARFAGIGRSTLFDWLKKGRDGDPDYISLVDEVDQAQAQAVVSNLVVIRNAAQGSPAIKATKDKPAQDARPPDWRAAAWDLEHGAHRRKFAPAIAMVIDSELEVFFDRLRERLPPETYEMIIAAARPDN
jgi:hypothetical protein